MYKVLPPDYQIDKLLLPSVDHRTGRARGGFEAPADAFKEDCCRARSLEVWLNAKVRGWVENQEAHKLRKRGGDAFMPIRPPADEANSLITRLRSDNPGETCASSRSMREARLHHLSWLLYVLRDYRNDELVTFTLINENWRFNHRQLESASAAAIKKQLRTHLDRAGVSQIPGPLFAALHGEFEGTHREYVLHFHGVTTVEKYAAIRKMSGRWGYVPTRSGATPIKHSLLVDRARQISYLMKSFWPQRSLRMVNGVQRRDRRLRRIVEPFHSLALLWLDRQKLADLVVLQGLRFTPAGELRVIAVADDGRRCVVKP